MLPVNAVGERLEGKPHEPFDGGAEETRWSRPVARLRSTLPRTSGSEGGLRKRTGRKTDTAPQPDPYVWRAQAEHASQSLAKGSRVVVIGRLQQRAWTAEDGSARSVVEVMAEELGPSLRWATATTTRTTRNSS
jgi:hypothetical protein